MEGLKGSVAVPSANHPSPPLYQGVAGIGVVNAVEVVLAFNHRQASAVGGGNTVEAADPLPQPSEGEEHSPRGLEAFREWLEAPDEDLIRAAARVGGGVAGEGEGGAPGPGSGNKEVQDNGGRSRPSFQSYFSLFPSPLPVQLTLYLTCPEIMAEFKKQHRNIRKTWQVPANFPSETVMGAYREPHVDRNKAKFSFGKPDQHLLRGFCM